MKAYADGEEGRLVVASEKAPQTAIVSAGDGPAPAEDRSRAFRPDGLPVGRPFTKGEPSPGGRFKGVPNRVTRQIRDQARRMVEDPRYRRRVMRDLRRGSLAPGLEAMLWYYAYGRPLERIRWTGTLPGRSDLVAALEQAWEQLRGRDPRRVGPGPAALPPAPDGQRG